MKSSSCWRRWSASSRAPTALKGKSQFRDQGRPVDVVGGRAQAFGQLTGHSSHLAHRLAAAAEVEPKERQLGGFEGDQKGDEEAGTEVHGAWILNEIPL